MCVCGGGGADSDCRVCAVGVGGGRERLQCVWGGRGGGGGREGGRRE